MHIQKNGTFKGKATKSVLYNICESEQALGMIFLIAIHSLFYKDLIK